MTTFGDPLPDVLAALQRGEMIILADDESRENEGDLVMSAHCITPAHMNFMIRYGSGIVCLAIKQEKADVLGLQPMVARNTSHRGTNFTVSIEAAQGVSTGVSAHERTLTIQAAIAAEARPEDLVQPGHVFPVVAHPGGVFARQGHTEASVALVELIGHSPEAVIVEIMNEDGSMARRDDLLRFKQAHGLKVTTVAALMDFLRSN